MAILALTGVIELWHLIALVVVYGTGQALFAPSFQAIVPEVVPPERLVQANSLQQLFEPLAFRLAGPALGGLVIGALGTGEAFLIDTLTYGVSIACVAMMRPLPRGTPSEAAVDRLRAARGHRTSSAPRPGSGPRCARRPSRSCSGSGRSRCCFRSWSRTSTAAEPRVSA